jgi:hypothetical protein
MELEKGLYDILALAYAGFSDLKLTHSQWEQIVGLVKSALALPLEEAV